MDLKIRPLDNQKDNNIDTKIKTPFSMYLNASKGGGKSTLILNLLLNENFLRKKFNRILWISPTSKFDEKIQKHTNNQDILVENVLLKKLIKKLKSKDILNNPDFEKRLPETFESDNIEFYDKFNVEIIKDVISYNSKINEEFGKKFGDNILIIIDDAIESKIFKSETFKNLMFKSRHYKISMIITSQSYFLLPKNLRLNMSYVVLFETGSKKEIEQIYEEHNTGLKPRGFYKMCSDLFEIPYNFLVINYFNPKAKRFQNQFLNFIDVSLYKNV